MHIEVCQEDDRRRLRQGDIRCAEGQPPSNVKVTDHPVIEIDCAHGECQDCREPHLGCRCLPGEG